jgi:hypothetical protein
MCSAKMHFSLLRRSATIRRCAKPPAIHRIAATVFLTPDLPTLAPFSMAINPLSPVTDYQSSLNRIFWFTSAAALGAVWLLRKYLPEVDIFLSRFDFDSQSGAGKLLPIAGGYLIPALGVGLVSRIFRVHSQVGHWLGIRERFDIDVILHELAQRIDLDVESVSDEEWTTHRHDLMRNAFYHFANSRSPQIDEHLIHQAIDLWSWFWIGLESAVVFVVTGLTLVTLGHHEVGLITFGAAIAGAVVALPLIRLECKRYAIAQVRAILADPGREIVVRQAFASLHSQPMVIRRVA